ncbi:hypothetical protein [Corynebacterium diphtheriae]|uniref:hypothetical protein n=1 Tax=Corynebacterium diphtheriae TaxID=1717 RepID=UPI000B301FEF|nr:hypothetical protein [Corynebacterium diphtheriae]CAB0897490.1 hypothetical protein FRC0419_00719 [Corynebacterium diphtheriae]CAB0944420.1 hypothetical protein FRC0466_00717 [Corynebacterium diphtheriae]
MPHPVGIHRLTEFGETIFATMSAHAQQHGAINLGQGFPDYDGPTAMLDIAREQIAQGFPVLREAVARHQRDYYDMDVAPRHRSPYYRRSHRGPHRRHYRACRTA